MRNRLRKQRKREEFMRILRSVRSYTPEPWHVHGVIPEPKAAKTPWYKDPISWSIALLYVLTGALLLIVLYKAFMAGYNA